MKKLFAIVLLFCAASCRTAATMSTPAELKAIPTSQSVALEVAIGKIEAGDPAWTVDGAVIRDAILGILRADKDAWDQLDLFYNGPK